MTDDPLLLSAQTLLDATYSAIEDAPPMADFQSRLSLFAQLENVRRELEGALDSIKRRADAMRGPLLKDMDEHGFQNVRVHGLSVFSRTDLIVHKLSNKDGVTTEMVCSALREIGRGDMVNDGYSGSSLKSLVKEYLDQAEEDGTPTGAAVPECLASLLSIERLKRLVTTKS